MAGRKQLPDQIKILKGTFQSCRSNKQQPRPGKGKLTAPDFLKPIAAEEYERKAELLDRLGVFGEGDDVALAAYAEAYERWRDAIEQIKKEPMVIKTKNENFIQNPHIGIANKAAKIMHNFLTEFGLTPSSRQRIKVDKPTKSSEWEAFAQNG